MSIIRKAGEQKQQKTRAGEDIEKLEPLYFADETIKWFSCLVLPQQVKRRIII